MSQPRSMDMEEEEQSPPFPFDLTGFPFDEATCSTMIHRRLSLFRKTLFIDALMETAGVPDSANYYPPHDFDSLRTLYETYDLAATEESVWKDCITYYLLCWWPDPKCARNFQKKRCMPPEYTQLAAAYFYLDRGDYKTGVGLLCDPRVPTIHSSLVMSVLATTYQTTYPLVRKYVHTTKPALVETWAIKVYMSALTLASLGSAWEYQRSFLEGDVRQQLIVTIIEECFLPEAKPHMLRSLIAFPFSPYEERILHDLAREPTHVFYDSPKGLTLLHDLVITRLITLGDPTGALHLEGQLPMPTRDEEAAKHAAARRRELISEAAGRDSATLYAMDIDEEPSQASYNKRSETPRRASRPIAPRRSFVYDPSLPKGISQPPYVSSPRGREPSNSFRASMRVPSIQVTPNSPIPVASTSRFATPPRHAVVDPGKFSRSQGAPSPNTPINFKLLPSAQPPSPLASASMPRSVSTMKNAFYDPSALEKPNLWGETSKQSSSRLSLGGPLMRKRSSLSQVIVTEDNAVGNEQDDHVQPVEEEPDNDSTDEVDQFVMNGARTRYKLPTPPPVETLDSLQPAQSPFRFRSSEMRSKKESDKGNEKESKHASQRRGVKRMASKQLELPGAFPRLEPNPPSPDDVHMEENIPPLSSSRKKTRQRTEREEVVKNTSKGSTQDGDEGDEGLEMEERDALPPLPGTLPSTATSTGRPRSSRRKRAGSVESDASDVSHSQPQRVRRSTRLSVAGSDTESVGPTTTTKGKKKKTRQGSVARSAASTGTRRKGKSKA